ncbi:hypothetical protein [Candidatus Litorirhabdus singularis]|nr:hypothetical protein [Candidatus Litorirhabdus singularis]
MLIVQGVIGISKTTVDIGIMYMPNSIDEIVEFAETVEVPYNP